LVILWLAGGSLTKTPCRARVPDPVLRRRLMAVHNERATTMKSSLRIIQNNFLLFALT
jgi:hypothetical protein